MTTCVCTPEALRRFAEDLRRNADVRVGKLEAIADVLEGGPLADGPHPWWCGRVSQKSDQAQKLLRRGLNLSAAGRWSISWYYPTSEGALLQNV